MTDQKFSTGDRIKVSFEADVTYATVEGINYITFSNGQELEFPEYLLPDDVVIEKLEKPLEDGWYLVKNRTTDINMVAWWDGTFMNLGIDSGGPVASYIPETFQVLAKANIAPLD